jgi:predicted transcriptional regulator
MRRSHLERYIDIINLLVQYGPQKQTHIMYNANVNFMVLKEDLRFLIKQALVEEQTIGNKRVVFGVTQRGINVIKYFHIIKKTSPIIEEEYIQ